LVCFGSVIKKEILEEWIGDNLLII
jgi:hypothetical protein